MISRAEAILNLEARVNRFDPEWPTRPKRVVNDALTLEKPWGWVLFYEVPEDFRTGKRGELAAENAPFLVNRRTGEMEMAGLDEPLDYYITRYEHRL